jgi:hypothetical protein
MEEGRIMLRTLESLFVVGIVFSAMLIGQSYIQIPSPREASSTGLQEKASSILANLDERGELTKAVFNSSNYEWFNIAKSIDSSLPSNVIYAITAYEVNYNSTSRVFNYKALKTAKNFDGVFPSGSTSAEYTVTSPDVTISQAPQKIGGDGAYTLYILNCNDANGWWITGYTSNTLAINVQKSLSPYFTKTILVNNTLQFGNLLKGNKITSDTNEHVKNAVVINPFGECVPIPQSNTSQYWEFSYYLGQKVNYYNWTWVSIVGYPFYYVSNTQSFSGQNNGWGIYGMEQVGPAGLNGFLQGIDGQAFWSNGNWVTSDIGVVEFTPNIKDSMNYYGIYPGKSQTATRALPLSYLNSYHLYLPNDTNGVYTTNIFNPVGDYHAGATYNHVIDGKISGSFMAIGLTRTPDIKVALIGLLSKYKPKILRSSFDVQDTTRVVILQLGQMGAD